VTCDPRQSDPYGGYDDEHAGFQDIDAVPIQLCEFCEGTNRPPHSFVLAEGCEVHDPVDHAVAANECVRAVKSDVYSGNIQINSPEGGFDTALDFLFSVCCFRSTALYETPFGSTGGRNVSDTGMWFFLNSPMCWGEMTKASGVDAAV
jgi:hypothetical protein